MVVRMRLQRFGRKNLPFYRIVVADAKAPRDGRFIEYLGSYDPIANKYDKIKEVSANVERVKYWIACGAQPSERVQWLFGRLGILPQPPQRNSNKDGGIPKSILAGKSK